MANLSDFLSSTAMRGTQLAGPGSNGYWRREIIGRPGTYTWTARKRGRVKFQMIGAAATGFSTRPGPSGAFGEKEVLFEVGQSVTIVIGAGGLSSGNTGRDGQTSSISGGPIGGTPLTLVGAIAPGAANQAGTEGRASGPWDLSFPGAVSLGQQTGSPASASPRGPGNASTGTGGAGWGGGAAGTGGASSHFPNSIGRGQRGFLATVGSPAQAFWDMRDIDSPGGNVDDINDSGPAAGTGAVSNTPGKSTLGGGTGYAQSSGPGGAGGFGAGGGAANAGAGPGGDALLFIFFDEVQ